MTIIELNVSTGERIERDLTSEEIAALPKMSPAGQISAIIAAIQRELDRRAQANGYDNIFTASLRAGFSGPFHDEGVAFAQWMDATWSQAYAVLAEVQAEPPTRSMPTSEEAVAMMPPLVLPE